MSETSATITPDNVMAGAVARLSRPELVTLAALLDRAGIAAKLGQQFGGDRDMYAVLGYPTALAFDDYLAEYTRHDIAGRIVDLPARDTWRYPPTIHDGDATTDDADPDSDFLRGVQDLADRLHLWSYCERVDRISGIGRYGVLLLGLRDGRDLAQEPGRLASTQDVLYLSAYAEGSAASFTLDKDPQSPRFGLPQVYTVSLGDQAQGFGTAQVHWARTVHVADDLLDDEVYGRPRLQRVYNRLQDLLKIIGGGAEAQWLNMSRGLHADVRDGYTLTEADGNAMSAEIDEYLHGLRRFIRTQGVNLNALGVDMIDPTGLFRAVLALVASATDIPQRILIGAEAGELASSQDQATWAGTIAGRRTKFAEAGVIRPLLDRLVTLGVLPAPASGRYTVTWQPLFELSALEKAQVAGAYAAAIATYSGAGAPAEVVPPAEFRQTWLGLAAEVGQDEGLEIRQTLLERKLKGELTAALVGAGAGLGAAATVAGFTDDEATRLLEVDLVDLPEPTPAAPVTPEPDATGPADQPAEPDNPAQE